MKHYVTAHRYGCGRLYSTYTLGPFRWRWVARMVAKFETFGTRGIGWSQEAAVQTPGG